MHSNSGGEAPAKEHQWPGCRGLWLHQRTPRHEALSWTKGGGAIQVRSCQVLPATTARQPRYSASDGRTSGPNTRTQRPREGTSR